MDQNVTELLRAARKGSPEASDDLFALVYQELRGVARRQLRKNSAGTLQTTALVHEAYLKLCDQASLDVRDRGHFFALASRVMRQVLVDHFRRRSSEKRGGNRVHLPFEDGDIPMEDRGDALLALDRALDKLAALNERLGRVVECRFFGGMTEQDIAGVLGVTDRTVRNDWVKARAWLSRELASE
jgi:RNA polymerase sigma factor (TIGR02999 family)